MPLTGAERMKRFRERQRAKGGYEQYKAKHLEEVKRSRAKQKEREKQLSNLEQKRLQKNRKLETRKRVAVHRCRIREQGQGDVQSPFSSAMAFAKATARARRMMTEALPSTPKRRRAVCRKLYSETSKEKQSTPRTTPKKSNALSNDTILKVKKFYERDDISIQAPGKRDVTIIRTEDGEKEKIQTKYLTSSLMETYALFREEHPEIGVGKSKFAELRPKYVLLSNKLPHNVCLCKYHENFILATVALHKVKPEFPTYSHTLPETFLCESASRSCWMNKCEKCKDGEGFRSKYQGLFEEATVTSWYVWKNDDNDRLCKAMEEGTTDDLEQYIISILPQFLQHCYIKRKQASSYKEEREAAVSGCDANDSSKALVQLDFSENYTCVAQDEIQSAHWKQNQVSLFTAALWYSGTLHSHVISSDNLTHSKETVLAFVDRLLEELSDTVESVSVWSDGPSSQFKNRYILSALSSLEKKHKMKLTWNYFATSHGKGPVDGIGGAVKRHIWGVVKSRKQLVNDAKSFVAAATTMKNVNVIELTAEDIENRNENLGLQSIFDTALPIPGVTQIHCAKVHNDDVQVGQLTQDIVSISVEEHPALESVISDKDFNPLQVKDWCQVNYDGDMFPGEVVAIEGQEYLISVMIQAGSTWRWPNPRDTVYYSREQIARKLSDPVPANNRGYFKFSELC